MAKITPLAKLGKTYAPTPDMLSPREAVDKAAEHLRMFFSPDATQHFRVEAVEAPGGKAEWGITFGWVETAHRTVGGNALGIGSGAKIERIPRVYKKIRISADDGAFRGMDPVDID